MIPDTLTVHLAIITAYALLAHAVILVHDGLHWDGWLVDFWQRTKSWQEMKRFYDEVGLTPLYYQHKLLAKVPGRAFVYRLIAFLSTLASAIAVYCICSRVEFLAGTYALLIALLYLSYTGYHMNIDTVVGLQYTFPTALFYWAVYFALLAGDYGGIAHASLRGTALLLFFLAFNANSLLVYYFGFLALKVMLGWDPAGDFLGAAYQELLGSVDYLVLPFAYWWLKNRLMPRHGHYESYNQIKMNPLALTKTLLDSVRFGFEAQITSPLKSAIEGHWLWIPATVAAVAYWLFAGSSGVLPVFGQPQIAALVGAGAMLFISGALPYALVGQFFFPEGWGTKHHMLFHLPVSLILLALVSWLTSSMTLLVAVVFILTCNAIYLNLVYLHHIAVAVKNRSWLYKLSKISRAQEASIFLITDRHSVMGDPCHREQEHRPAYIFCMLEWLWGSRTRCGFQFREPAMERLDSAQIAQRITNSSLDYAMGNVNVEGRQVRLVISNAIDYSPAMIGLMYLKERYLPGGNVERLLEAVTDLSYTDLQ